MEILKRFKSWLSFKKDVPPETRFDSKPEEKNTNKKKRSIKRYAEPVSEEESVRRKCYKKETPAESSRKSLLEEDKDFEGNTSLPKEIHLLKGEDRVRMHSPAKENDTRDENEDTLVLNDYEIKTIGNIHEIRVICKEFDSKIEMFTDVMGSKQFLYVDEKLQSHIEKLDRIDAKESTRIRQERKSAIKYICLLIDRLEAIAKRNHERLKPRPQIVAPISREQFLEGKKEE